MLQLVRTHIDYRWFFIGQVVSQLGDRIHSLALLWLVYSWSGSAAAVGGVMVATSLPGVLFSPLAGSLCDRVSKRTLMIAADLIRFVTVMLLALTAWTGWLNYPILIGATIVISLAGATFNPAALALIPALVPHRLLTQANAMNQLSGSGSAVLGPLFGSLLIAAIGVPLAFFGNGLSFLTSWFCVSRIKIEEPPVAASSLWQDMRDGFSAVVGNQLIKSLLPPIAVVNFFFAAVVVVIPVLAEGVFQRGSTGLGILMSTFGGGMLVGTLLLSLIRSVPRGPVLITAFLLMGSAFLLVGLSTTFTIALAALFTAGCCLTSINILLIVLFQTILPSEFRGKVMALVSATALSLQPIAYGLTGIALELLSPSLVLISSGLVIAGSGCYLWFCRPLRTIQP
ncbi:MFS transporter [Desulfofustis limnaeus]|jgi:MFS family permease|uniref:MFS transporter n=1 Tax=Desulfofustis limnaeus TaxID=2740163 RepID=A0ABM7WAZ0_9BACT|nr:MFS transporter [Desulfofustis limnaeus]MDX9896055.1 MFS transporter [Desulfofustis sp.]BDD88089.1 MFS transporter [Desulfofustis limnaeus]